MFSLLKRDRSTCKSLRNSLEDASGADALSPVQQKHLAVCLDCQAAADELLMSRILLKKIPSVAATPAPWFAPRVMAAIAARESELRRSLEAWAAVPRFAARLAWISALALLLASTWLYQLPKSTPKPSGQATVDTLFDIQPSAAQDDLLLAQERGQ
jgi:hypothetical protein